MYIYITYIMYMYSLLFYFCSASMEPRGLHMLGQLLKYTPSFISLLIAEIVLQFAINF
jgi:hypothetical protein